MVTKLSTVTNSFMCSEMVNNDITASSADINRSKRRACHASSLATSSSSKCTPSTVDTLYPPGKEMVWIEVLGISITASDRWKVPPKIDEKKILSVMTTTHYGLHK